MLKGHLIKIQETKKTLYLLEGEQWRSLQNIRSIWEGLLYILKRVLDKILFY